MFSQTFACYVERRPMIDGRANKWQAHSNVDSLSEGKTLHRDHGLIMITGDNCIKFASRRTQKYCISRERSAHIDIIHAMASLDSRNYLRRFLDTKETSFGAVWIQRSYRQARSFDTPPS